MANTVSIYRSKSTKAIVSNWWRQTARSNQKRATTEEMFHEYIVFVCSPNTTYLSGIMSYSDFARCLYSIGVVNMHIDLEGAPIYKQLESWRPSLDQIKRLQIEPLS